MKTKSNENFVREVTWMLKNWRLWVIFAQTAVCITLLAAEPEDGMPLGRMLAVLAATKAGALVLLALVAAELRAWQRHFGCFAAEEEDDAVAEGQDTWNR